MTISPQLALASFALAVVNGVWSTSIFSPLLFCAVIVSYIAFYEKKLSRVFFQFSAFFIPFVPPLIFIHSILNSTFQVSENILGFIPFRSDGFDYAMVKVTAFLALFGAGCMVIRIDKGEMVDWLIGIRLSTNIITTLAQVFSLGAFLITRAQQIIIAQQARGIDVSSHLIAKIKALSMVLIPTFVSAVKESEMKTIVLVSRGLGENKLSRTTSSTISFSEFLVFILLVGIATEAWRFWQI